MQRRKRKWRAEQQNRADHPHLAATAMRGRPQELISFALMLKLILGITNFTGETLTTFGILPDYEREFPREKVLRRSLLIYRSVGVFAFQIVRASYEF